METLVAKLTWTDALFLCAVTVCVVLIVARRSFDDLYAFRRRRRERIAERGRAFGVLPRPALPHEGDGPGLYLVSGVVERTGAPARFEVEASGVPDALRKAMERGVSPANATKRHAEHAA